MKKVIIGLVSVVTALLIFAGGVYASEQGWLNFTGEETVNTAQSDVSRIMEILKELDEGRSLTQDELNILKGDYEELNSKYKTVKGERDEAQTTIAQLESLLEEGPPGLVNKIKTLVGEVERLEEELAQAQTDSEYVTHLEAELKEANEQINILGQDISNHLQEAETYVGD